MYYEIARSDNTGQWTTGASIDPRSVSGI